MKQAQYPARVEIYHKLFISEEHLGKDLQSIMEKLGSTVSILKFLYWSKHSRTRHLFEHWGLTWSGTSKRRLWFLNNLYCSELYWWTICPLWSFSFENERSAPLSKANTKSLWQLPEEFRKVVMKTLSQESLFLFKQMNTLRITLLKIILKKTNQPNKCPKTPTKQKPQTKADLAHYL